MCSMCINVDMAVLFMKCLSSLGNWLVVKVFDVAVRVIRYCVGSFSWHKSQ
jgi:hypothetical protein